MSKISDLRESEKYKLNLIPLLEKMLPGKKTKYVELLTRFVNDDFKLIMKDVDNIETINKLGLENESLLTQVFTVFFMENILSEDDLEVLKYFSDKHDTNVITKVDLQTITMDDISELCEETKIKEREKNLENKIFKILDNDEWLILLPFTHKSSMKYGANTKWCTTSKETEQHFETYSEDGALIYIIDKSKNKKLALYYEYDCPNNTSSDITCWDEEDNCIELIFSGLPMIVLDAIREHLTQYPKISNVNFYNNVFKDEDEEEEEEEEEKEETVDDVARNLLKEYSRIGISSDGRYYYNPYSKF